MKHRPNTLRPTPPKGLPMAQWLLYFPLILPACALLAGAVTWVLIREQEPDSTELLMDFGAVLGLALLCSYGVLSLR